MSLAKAFAVAAYGESVAAYRYRSLVEKAPSDNVRKVFAEMAVEEQEHHVRIQDHQKKQFPESDFVLTPEDKDLVIVGPRLLDVSDAAATQRAMDFIYESERLTGSFYAALHDVTTAEELKPMLREMADECFEHAGRLKAIRWEE